MKINFSNLSKEERAELVTALKHNLSNEEKAELWEALRPKGRWVETDTSDACFPQLRCTHCGLVQGYRSNFCEECGYDMRGSSAVD